MENQDHSLVKLFISPIIDIDMKKIFKYPIEVTDEQVVLLPTGAKVLTIQSQGEVPCIWALVNPTAPRNEAITIRIHGTGHDVPDSDNLEYVSTFQMMGGRLVFHSFIVK